LIADESHRGLLCFTARTVWNARRGARNCPVQWRLPNPPELGMRPAPAAEASVEEAPASYGAAEEEQA
jgi:hypothetical protein